jgi:7-cyano-7-deazaguanine synthase
MKTILIYSGGMDSTVLLYHLLNEGYTVKALSVDYGQRHKKEIECARLITQRLNVEHLVADLTGITSLLGGSSLTSADIDVPEGHYAEDNMKATVVPNRNMIMLSVATGWAISTKCDSVSYAAHSGDHAIYPDCREEFAQAVDQAIQLADWHKVVLNRPFVTLTKADIVALGSKLGVPFEDTWSCYKGGDLHCGRCGTCVERREAFHLAGVEDPTPYGAEAPSLEEMIQTDWKL